MKKIKKLFLLSTLVCICALTTSITYANSLKLSATSENGKVQLNWENPFGDSKNYPYAYRLYKSTDNGNSFKTISMWTENDEVQVLNVYPNVNYNVEYQYRDGTKEVRSKAAGLKMWMEGGTMIENGVPQQFENYGRDINSGRQLIKVNAVTFDQFNANPESYLKGSNGDYKYDVIAFGTWDGNAWQDLNQNSANATANFIKSGRGAFFGHDTLYEGTAPIMFNTLSPYVNIEKAGDVTQYTGEVESETGRGQIGSNSLSTVKITSKSSLTSYPWDIGDVGTILTVPGAHNLQSAKGQILMRFTHPTYSNADNIAENFFLTLNNNTAMSQTGHSVGNSTADERKILANTLFYLKQVSLQEHATDTEITDNVAPENLNASIIGCPVSDDYKKRIQLSAKDKGVSYKYYLEGIPQTQGHGSTMTSNTITQEAYAGVDSFWYTINSSSTAISKPSVNDKDWKKANQQDSYEFDTQVLDQSKTQYIHYFAKDKAGNISKETIFTIPKNQAPTISIREKSFYENEYSQEQWSSSKRDSGLSAYDTEDGNLSSKIQLISDTTKVDVPGTYKATYKVKDSGCLTVTKENTIKVKYNNPPVINSVNKSFYEGEYTSSEWYSTLQMKDITASDVEDGKITNKIHVISDNVDVSKQGEYAVAYEIIDAFGKKGTATSKVTVKFNNPPVITAKDQSFYEDEITLKDWKKLRNDIVNATDIEDGNIKSKIEILRDNVNPTIPDHYQIEYKVTDRFGKSTNKVVNVQIKYNNPPRITGKNKRFMENELTKDEWLKERIDGIEATDTEDGDLTTNIKVIEDHVKLNEAGFYRVVYEVTDAYGKSCVKTIEVEIVYNQLPLIIAENKMYYENELTKDQWLNDEIMKDVFGLDAEDGDLTTSITYQENLDVSKQGTYEVTYRVKDSGGKEAIKTIDVMIRKNHTPILDIFAENKRFVEGQYTIEEWINQLRMENVSASDIEDNDLTDKIEIIKDTVDPNKSGIYEVTYKVTDKFNKSKEITIKVTVEANLVPVIHATDRWFTTNDTISEKELLKKVIAYDDLDGELTDKVKIKSSKVIEGQVGEYSVVYTVTDSLGKTGLGEAIIHITEIDPAPLPPVNPPTPPSDNDAVIFANGKKYGTVTLEKVMEFSEILNGTDYESVVFGVYADEDIYWKDVLVLKKDSLVGTIRLDGTNKGRTKVYHEGEYFVKEIAVDNQYIISNEKFKFKFEF